MTTTIQCPVCEAEVDAEMGKQFCGECGSQLEALPVAPPRRPLIPTWAIVVGGLVIVLGSCLAMVFGHDTNADRVATQRDRAAVVSRLHSGDINTLTSFQKHCGVSDERADRPATKDAPAHIGLLYKPQNIAVLFLRRKVGTSAAELAKSNAFNYFDEPTFWTIDSHRMVTTDDAVKALGCK